MPSDPAPETATVLSVEQLLRHGDRAMVLAQRLTEWIAHAPDLEQDMALANLGLDLIGQARGLYSLAGEREGRGRDEDDLAYLRDPDDFRSPALVEQPNGDFAHTVVRQFLHDAYAAELWPHLSTSPDTEVRHLAAKITKETIYHLRYSRGWVVRLGDGTDESHRRMTDAVGTMWPFVDGLFDDDERRALRPAFDSRVATTFAEATLTIPESIEPAIGTAQTSPLLVDLLTEMQELRRAHPGARW